MKIKYKQQVEDFHDFIQYHYWYAPDRKFFRWRTYLSLPLIALVFVVLETLRVAPEVRLNYALNLGFVVSIISIAYLFQVKSWLLARLQRNNHQQMLQFKNEEMFGEKELQFTSEKIYSLTLHSKSEMNWESIEKVRISDHYFFLYNNAFVAHVIPKTAVEDKRAFEELLAKKVTLLSK